MRTLVAAVLLVAAIVLGTGFITKQYTATVTSQLTAEVKELTSTVQTLKEQNSILSDQNLKLESIKAQLKQLVCDQVDKKSAQAIGMTPPPPSAPAPTAASAQTVTPVQMAPPPPASAEPPPAKKNDFAAPASTNPAANMNAQQLDPVMHFPFDLPPDRQRQLDDTMARHNVESLTEFQERFAGRKPDPAEIAQFAKERKQRLLANLKQLLDDEQYQQAQGMLLHEKD
jgi:hypothetical protein